MNKVILVGNLTRDPELSETASGLAVCRLGIAVQRKDASREADFFNVTVWRESATNCGKYLKKGNKVAIVGTLQNRSYEDKDGIKRNVTDIIASEVEFLTPKGAQAENEITETVTARRERPASSELEEIDDNQLPF